VTRGDIVQVVSEVLTEVLIDDIGGTSRVFKDLSQIGVKIALDDFGTGYSSLSYLRALPLDRLKIDRSFIAAIAVEEGRSVVQAIIDLCRRLNLDVIAEGVETEFHVETLRDMGCDLLQGYHLSRPLRAADIAGSLPATQAKAN